MYLPKIAFFLASLSFSQAATTIIAYFGDSDVQTTGSWTSANTCGNNTEVSGSSATLTFTGTSVSFVGTHQSGGGNIAFSLDGGSPSTVFSGLGGGVSAFICNRVLYRSPELPNGRHTLTATLSDGGSMAMEYFTYTVPDSPTATANEPDASVASSSPNSSQVKKNTVSSGGAAGIFFGGAIGGSLLVAIGLFVVPIIRRKALSQGAVTGEVQSGLYRVLNDRHLNVAAAADANHESVINGISYGRVPDHKWDIIRKPNGRYQIRNHGHNTVYAGWSSSPLPQHEDHLVNSSESDTEWRIEETNKGSRKYRIYAIGHDEKDKLCWALTYDNPRTPITILKSSDDTSQLWTLCLLEAHNESA